MKVIRNRMMKNILKLTDLRNLLALTKANERVKMKPSFIYKK